jgi:tetratricopeptide (TPR) repeat protein
MASGLAFASKPVKPEDAAGWAHLGHSRYEHCEFKGAAGAFRRALEYQPKDADLHHWLGKSYAKMAELAGPIHASRDARKARASLEQAVELAPANHEYLRELFDFYLDSPEWMGGGIARAELLIERMEPGNPPGQAFLRALVEGSRQEHEGVYWRLRQATLIPSAQISRVIR